MELPLPNTREECGLYDKIFNTASQIQKINGYASANEILNKSGVPDGLPIINWLRTNNHLTLWNNIQHCYNVVGNPEFVKAWDKREAEKSIAEIARLAKEEKENNEWEMKIRGEQRDVDRIRYQKRAFYISIVSLIIGFVGGFKCNPSTQFEKTRNNGDNSSNVRLLAKPLAHAVFYLIVGKYFSFGTLQFSFF